MPKNIVEYVLTLKDKTFSSGIKKASTQVDKLDNEVKKVNKSISAGTALAATAAAAAIGVFAKKSIDAFDKQAKAEAQVRQGLISTKNVSGKTFQELTKQASDLQKKTIFGDEDILQNVTAQLLTFTNITESQFDKTQMAALNLATRMGGDTKGAALQLGKALNDPKKNLSALSRSGIQFSDDQIKVIKSLQETNRIAEAQDIILKELETQFGGSAEAAAKAGKGGLTQLSNRLGDIQEVIGGAILPIINFFAELISKVADVIERNTGVFTTFVQILGVFVAIIGVLVGIIQIWTAVQWALNIALFANPIGLIILAIAALVAIIVVAYKQSETFRGILQGVFAVVSKVAKFLFKVFIAGLKELWKGLKFIGEAIMNFLQKPIELAMNAFNKFLDLLEKIPGVGKMIKNIRNTFSKGFSKGVQEFRKEQEKSKIGERIGIGSIGSVAGEGGVGLGSGIVGAGGGQKNSQQTVTSAAPKQFNININKLVENFNIKTENIKEAPASVKEMIEQALLEALADIEIAR